MITVDPTGNGFHAVIVAMETVSIDGQSGSESVGGREAIRGRAAEERAQIGNKIFLAVGKPSSGERIRREYESNTRKTIWRRLEKSVKFGLDDY